MTPVAVVVFVSVVVAGVVVGVVVICWLRVVGR